MKPRERVLRSCNHEEPDRVPLDYWTTPAAYEKLRDYLRITAPETQEWGIMANWKISEDILERLHIDIRRVYMNPSAKFEVKTYPDGTTDSEYGFRGKWFGPYWEVTHYPWAEFTEVEQVEAYEWPDVSESSRMEGVVKWAKYLHEETDYAVAAMSPGPWGVFEINEHYMRGFDKFLIDLATNKRLAEAMMDKCMEFALDMNAVFLDEISDYIDIFQAGDDLGHQHGQIISPKMYRDLIKPRHKKMYGEVKKRAPHVKILYHSCGAIEPFINDLIDVGVDILNPIQPLARDMDSASLKEKYGDRIIFHGGIDLQRAMAEQGTIEDVRQEVDTRLAILGPGGGYILAPAHNLQPDSTPEKVLEIYDYAMKRGIYPINI